MATIFELVPFICDQAQNQAQKQLACMLAAKH